MVFCSTDFICCVVMSVWCRERQSPLHRHALDWVLLLSTRQIRYIPCLDRPRNGERMRTLVKTVVALVAVAVLSATAVNVLTSPSPKTGSYPVVESAAVGSIGFADSDMWG